MRVSFSFDDRVAGRYNAQRAHPPEVARQIGLAIAAQSGTDARVLEIGVGTGRIAWPVVAAGCRVVGLDLSSEMLTEVFQEKRPFPTPSLLLVRADMHHLPFCKDSFDATLAVHVLHLAKDWRQVVREAVRLLRPGGAFIQGDDWIDPQSVVGRLRDELRLRALALSPQLRPPAAGVSQQQLLADLGATTVTEVIAAEWTTWISPQERLTAIAQRLDAESWMLPDTIFETLWLQLQEFAANTWPDLEEPQAVTRRFVLQVTRGNW